MFRLFVPKKLVVVLDGAAEPNVLVGLLLAEPKVLGWFLFPNKVLAKGLKKEP